MCEYVTANTGNRYRVNDFCVVGTVEKTILENNQNNQCTRQVPGKKEFVPFLVQAKKNEFFLLQFQYTSYKLVLFILLLKNKILVFS